MYDALFDHIELKSGEKLTDDEQQVIMAAFHHKRILKRHYFLREGDVCKYIGFIAKGSARMFAVDEKGHEHIIGFGLESWWISDQESLVNLTPSPYYIEMLEDSELLLITLSGARELRLKSRCFNLAVSVLDKIHAIAMQKRIHAAIGMTAEEKYCDLSVTYPEIIDRFPINMIASYLGLSPETLSRIRRNAALK